MSCAGRTQRLRWSRSPTVSSHGESAPVGMVSAAHVLGAIAKNVIDKAPMKIMSGHRDLGFNVPITPCQRNCPIRQDIATYIDYVSQGRYVDSWAVIHETNPFPSMLGRLCNHPCETDCKRGWDPGEEPVTIKSIKRFSTDFAFQQGLWINYKIAPAKGKRVAVVGAGPAGLTCALDLRVQGYDVVLYEREAKVGGLLSTSIPPFRFDHRQLQWELDMIMSTGIDVRLNSNIGGGPDDIKTKDLLDEYDAVFFSIGMMKGRILPIPGSDLPEVTDAMSFLRTVSYDKIPEHFPIGGSVVVVGGGAVATDACQSSIKLGAKDVWMVAIEPEDRLPAFGNELHEAKEIGLHIQCGVIVKSIQSDDNGKVKSVSFAPLKDLEFDPLSGKLIFSSVKEQENVPLVGRLSRLRDLRLRADHGASGRARPGDAARSPLGGPRRPHRRAEVLLRRRLRAGSVIHRRCSGLGASHRRARFASSLARTCRPRAIASTRRSSSGPTTTASRRCSRGPSRTFSKPRSGMT